MKKIVVALAAVAAWSLVTGAGAIPGPEVFLSPLDGPPAGAIPLIENGNMEADPPDLWWTNSGDSEIDEVYSHSPTHSLHQGGVDAWGWAEMEFDLSPCAPGPVWVRVAYDIMTVQPADPLEMGFDVTEGFVLNEQNLSVAYLWERYDQDHTGGWLYPWIRVDGLTEAVVRGRLRIASQTDDNPESRTDFVYDDLQMWCIPANPPEPHRAYLPAVLR